MLDLNAADPIEDYLAALHLLDGFPMDAVIPWGFGFALQTEAAPAVFSELASFATFGHPGASGCQILVDPAADLLVVLLTNTHILTGRDTWLRRQQEIVNACFALATGLSESARSRPLTLWLPLSAPLGETLELPFVHVGDPLPARLGRWADPRVRDDVAVAQGLHVGTILVDPGAYRVSSTHGPVAGDQDFDVARDAVEQVQRGEVVLDRVSGVEVEHRNEDVGEHVAGDEHPAFLDEQRRMARGVRLVFQNPDA
jgi:hypothetical protein